MVLDHGTTIAISSIANLMVSGKNFKWYFNASFTLLQDCYGFLIGYLSHCKFFLKKIQIVYIFFAMWLAMFIEIKKTVFLKSKLLTWNDLTLIFEIF